MDPELLSVIRRYVLMGSVLFAAVIWTVWYSTDKTRGTIGAPSLQAPVSSSPTAPGASRFVVERNGQQRVLCEPACALEASCELRAKAQCVDESCDGDVRKLNAADFLLEGAAGCAAVALTPCEEACRRQGDCKEDHSGDPACTSACKQLLSKASSSADAQKVWRQARCIVETRDCDVIQRCRDG